MIYLNHSIAVQTAAGRLNSEGDLARAIIAGARLRVRPIVIAVAVIIGGLLLIMWGSGTGSELMQCIVSPMAGGMITAPLLSMLVVPTVCFLLRRRSLQDY